MTKEQIEFLIFFNKFQFVISDNEFKKKYHILSCYFVNLLINDYLFKLDSLIKHFVKTTNILVHLALARMSSVQNRATHRGILSAIWLLAAQSLERLTGDNKVPIDVLHKWRLWHGNEARMLFSRSILDLLESVNT